MIFRDLCSVCNDVGAPFCTFITSYIIKVCKMSPIVCSLFKSHYTPSHSSPVTNLKVLMIIIIIYKGNLQQTIFLFALICTQLFKAKYTVTYFVMKIYYNSKTCYIWMKIYKCIYIYDEIRDKSDIIITEQPI